MNIEINLTSEIGHKQNLLVIVHSVNELKQFPLSVPEISYIKSMAANKEKFIPVNHYNRWICVQIIPDKKDSRELLEAMRREASKIKAFLNKSGIRELVISGAKVKAEILLAYAEGLVLNHYTFLKYYSDKEEKQNQLKQVYLHSPGIGQEEMEELNICIESVCFARDLVNEPLSYLDTSKLCDEIRNLSKKSGLSVEILGKKQIQSLKMGGLLSVNKASLSDPAFIILKWKPENAINKKPLILVGKGVVYDTGGLSLKPTTDSMDYMKCDMGGAAVAAATTSAVARLKLPVYLIALIPVTDNLISNTAYVPGDVIRMHNKKTVEVLNTDAEGRLILADALSYASKYKPELVIDIATLTGAAAMAYGHYAMAVMGSASEKIFRKIESSSWNTYERIIKLPLFEDYGELLKSDIADIKNIGGRIGGAITAGKFLEAFTDFPWIHMDIAGPAWVNKEYYYLTKGGTGFGIRLLIDFIKFYN